MKRSTSVADVFGTQVSAERDQNFYGVDVPVLASEHHRRQSTATF
jgi:hypothetical protein